MASAGGAHDVLVVGAGFSGLYLLHRLRAEGSRVRLIEASDGLGGVWQNNRYPGARVDSHVPNYEYSIEAVWRDWSWTERFPGRDELVALLRSRRRRAGPSARHRPATRGPAPPRSTRRDTGGRSRRTSSGRTRAGTCCCAPASVRSRTSPTCRASTTSPAMPPHGAVARATASSLEGRRVGVIGTGASGVQVVQEAARGAAHRHRVPAVAGDGDPDAATAPRPGAAAGREGRRTPTCSGGGTAHRRASPTSRASTSARSTCPAAEREEVYEDAWRKGGFHFWAGTFSDVLIDERGEPHRLRLLAGQDPGPDRRRRHRRGAGPDRSAVPVRDEAAVAGADLLRVLQPVERRSRRPAGHADRDDHPGRRADDGRRRRARRARARDRLRRQHRRPDRDRPPRPRRALARRAMVRRRRHPPRDGRPRIPQHAVRVRPAERRGVLQRARLCRAAGRLGRRVARLRPLPRSRLVRRARPRPVRRGPRSWPSSPMPPSSVGPTPGTWAPTSRASPDSSSTTRAATMYIERLQPCAAAATRASCWAEPSRHLHTTPARETWSTGRSSARLVERKGMGPGRDEDPRQFVVRPARSDDRQRV